MKTLGMELSEDWDHYNDNRLDIWFEQGWLVKFGYYEEQEVLYEDEFEHDDCPFCECERYETKRVWIDGKKIDIGALSPEDFEVGVRRTEYSTMSIIYSHDKYCGYWIEDDFKNKVLKVFTNSKPDKLVIDNLINQ